MKVRRVRPVALHVRAPAQPVERVGLTADVPSLVGHLVTTGITSDGAVEIAQPDGHLTQPVSSVHDADPWSRLLGDFKCPRQSCERGFEPAAAAMQITEMLRGVHDSAMRSDRLADTQRLFQRGDRPTVVAQTALDFAEASQGVCEVHALVQLSAQQLGLFKQIPSFGKGAHLHGDVSEGHQRSRSAEAVPATIGHRHCVVQVANRCLQFVSLTCRVAEPDQRINQRQRMTAMRHRVSQLR